MDVLADTNILLRKVHRNFAGHTEAVQALRVLRERGDRVCVVPQNLYEFWVVATRPIQNNGLALSPAQAGRMTSRIEEVCVLLRDPPALYDEWRRLVGAYALSGKSAHDARLVAAMKVHGITQILSFNADDFARYSEVTVIDPSVLAVDR
jgi:predicted nucleic acid-binding protein